LSVPVFSEASYLGNNEKCQIQIIQVVTYSEKEISSVFNYVKNQEIHHQKMTFREEYLMMLKAHKVEFLPEYLFKELE
jgi:putative transposase